MSAYSNLVIADGASNFWRLNEPSGTTAVDIVGGKNGTISGGVTLNQAGALSDGDPSMAFNGTTGKVATAAGVIALGTGSVTVEAWCKSSAALTQRFVVDGALEANLNFPGVLIRAMTVPSLNVLALKGDGTTAVEVAWGTPWTDGAWRHIVGVVSRGAPDQLLLYGNGALIASLPFPTAGWNLTSAQPWCIGNSVASGLPWGGLLDDVAIYPVALSPAQIAAHYTVGKIGKTAPTTYADRVILDGASNYWRLNEPSGTTAVDVIGGKNGTISGGVTLAQPGALSDGDKAMTFDTTGQIATIAFTFPSPLSVEGWFRNVATNPSGKQGMLLRNTEATLWFVVNNQLNGSLFCYDGAVISAPLAYIDGQWHHAVLTRDGTTNRIYIDGAQVISGAQTAVSSTTGAVIGAALGGSLDEVAIYPSALSPAQIAAHYTVGKIGKTAPTTYADRVILDGASSFWRLNEPSGTTAVDVIGGKNGTISGGVTLNQQGALGDGDPAMAFNGTTGKIVTAASVLLSPFTIELWIRRANNAISNQVLFCNTFGTGDNLVIWTRPDETVLYNGVTGTNVVFPYDTQWHHLAYIFAAGVPVKVYIDGTARTVSDPTPMAFSAGTVKPFEFGFDPNWAYFNGALDDIAIYPVALTPAQIAAHYQARLLSGSRRPLPAFVLAHRRFPS